MNYKIVPIFPSIVQEIETPTETWILRNFGSSRSGFSIEHHKCYVFAGTLILKDFGYKLNLSIREHNVSP